MLTPCIFLIFYDKDKGRDETKKADPSKKDIKKTQDKERNSEKIRIFNPVISQRDTSFHSELYAVLNPAL